MLWNYSKDHLLTYASIELVTPIYQLSAKIIWSYACYCISVALYLYVIVCISMLDMATEAIRGVI